VTGEQTAAGSSLDVAPSPAWRLLGIRLAKAGGGMATLEMECTEAMRNHQGTVHGGFISTLADSAMGTAIASVLPEGERHFSFDLKLSFIAPARPGDRLLAIGRVVHAGRRTGVADCQVTSGDDRLVATASGSFAIQLPGNQPS
jgi:uncharacterized protein (TIGR00369 family)